MGGKGNRGRASGARLKKSPPTAGRPPLVSNEALLEQALGLFAEYGYEGMSVRLLNQRLGISHNTVNKRFGSKLALWYAAVDQGFTTLRSDLVAIVTELQGANEPREIARRGITAFLRSSLNQPDILRLMNYEGAQSSERLSYLFETHLRPLMSMVNHALQSAAAKGTVRQVSLRAIMFLLAHGAAAPFTLAGLSREYDSLSGALDEEEHIVQITEFLVAGIFRD